MPMTAAMLIANAATATQGRSRIRIRTTIGSSICPPQARLELALAPAANEHDVALRERDHLKRGFTVTVGTAPGFRVRLHGSARRRPVLALRVCHGWPYLALLTFGL